MLQSQKRIHFRKSDLKRKSIFHSMKSNNLENLTKLIVTENLKSNRSHGELWPQVSVGLFTFDLCCVFHSKYKHVSVCHWPRQHRSPKETNFVYCLLPRRHRFPTKQTHTVWQQH